MPEALLGFGFLCLFTASAMAGMALRGRLSNEHLSNDNMDAVRMMTGLLVTFAALVLSLQLSISRSAYDAASKNRSTYAAELARLDQCLRDLGPDMQPVRLRLRQYTAAVIASTWRDEPAPVVEGMPDPTNMATRGEDSTLGGLLRAIGAQIDAAVSRDAAGLNTAARCRSDYTLVLQGRWAVIEDTHAPSGYVYMAIISLWLALVFLSFGLQIPRRLLPAIVLAIGVGCVSSVLFVIVDLETPYGGFFGIPSTAMREALSDMSR